VNSTIGRIILRGLFLALCLPGVSLVIALARALARHVSGQSTRGLGPDAPGLIAWESGALSLFTVLPAWLVYLVWRKTALGGSFTWVARIALALITGGLAIALWLAQIV
jgi:hypothetical protein